MYFAEGRLPPNAAIGALLLLAFLLLGLAHSWWRSRRHALFRARKKEPEQKSPASR
jgi:hypothetical protein